MPTVILEAMACGLAVVATDVGAVAELVDARSGWLIPRADAGALATALREAIELDDDALLERKVASHDRVQHGFLWDQVATATLRAIEDVLQELER